jgi:alkylation response protein AidB-like acyl-CoA dehydrogenase
VSGSVAAVAAADVAHGFIVAPETASGAVLAWVERAAPGLSCPSKPTVDAGSVATLTFTNVDARVLAGANRTPALVAQAYDRLLLAASAELLGAMERAHAVAVLV